MTQDVKILHTIIQILEQIRRTSEVTDLFSWMNPSSWGQWLWTGIQSIACLIIIEFATIILFRCILSGLQCALPLTLSLSATQAVNVLAIDLDTSGITGWIVPGALFCLFCFVSFL